MHNYMEINGRKVGEGFPVFVIAEIGLNHNGDIEIAKELIDAAVEAGCDAVKFQKRDPELCVPKEQRDMMRETPWGYISYMDYRYKVEFGKEDYDEIDRYCKLKGILWSASCWDVNSLEFLNGYDVSFHKVASAMVTDSLFLQQLVQSGKPVICSTGMSTMADIASAASILSESSCDYALLHCTSTYPCPLEEINLKVIPALKQRFKRPVGYSGHETGLVPTWAAVSLGACIVERHITLDRAMWGSDQAASVEPGGFARLVGGIRDLEKALGNGRKKIYDSEAKILKRLRKK